MSGRALLLLLLGAAACTRPNPFFLDEDEDEANDDDAPAATASGDNDPADDDTGSEGESGGETGPSAGDTCGDACGDPDRECIDGTVCTGDLEWLWRSGDEHWQHARDVAVLSDGSLVVVGSFTGTLGDGDHLVHADPDPLESDAFVLRIDPAGELVWLHAFDGPGQQTLTAVAALPGDTIAVAGQFNEVFDTGPITLQDLGDAPGMVGTLTADGEWIFAEGLPGAAIEVVDLAADPAGTITVAGNFTGDFPLVPDLLDTPDPDLFAARYDATGTLVWSRVVQADDVQRIHALAATPDGGVVLAGEFAGTLSLPNDSLSAQSVDALLLALDATGTPTWARALGGPEVDVIDAISVAADGTLLLAGTHGPGFELAPDLAVSGPRGFLAALDPSGAPRWTHSGLDLGPGAPRLALDVDGRAVALLPIASVPIDLGSGPLGASPGAVLIKMTASGNVAWQHSLAADVTGFAAALATGPNSEVALAGTFAPTLALADQSLQSAGDHDVFTARLRP